MVKEDVQRESNTMGARGIAWLSMMLLVLLTLVAGAALVYLASEHRLPPSHSPNQPAAAQPDN